MKQRRGGSYIHTFIHTYALVALPQSQQPPPPKPNINKQQQGRLAPPRFHTNVRVYHRHTAIAFEQLFPLGTEGADSGDQDNVISSFPAFAVGGGGDGSFWAGKGFLTFAHNMWVYSVVVEWRRKAKEKLSLHASLPHHYGSHTHLQHHTTNPTIGHAPTANSSAPSPAASPSMPLRPPPPPPPVSTPSGPPADRRAGCRWSCLATTAVVGVSSRGRPRWCSPPWTLLWPPTSFWSGGKARCCGMGCRGG